MRTKTCIICWKSHSNTMSKSCSPWCERKHRANLNKANQEKVKIKKEKAKEKKVNSIKTLTKRADDLWKDAVKINYNYRCQYCNKWPEEVQLHSHHLFTRNRKATRWDIDNWICLCASHHTLSSEFSAHMTGNEFFLWLEWIKWRNWIDDLMHKSQWLQHVTPEFLREQITILEEFIANNK